MLKNINEILRNNATLNDLGIGEPKNFQNIHKIHNYNHDNKALHTKKIPKKPNLGEQLRNLLKK